MVIMGSRFLLTLLLPVLMVGLIAGSSCRSDEAAVVMVATTTSAANTGLLDYLLPEFQNDVGIQVDYIATGTGRALMHGRNGDVDVVLVHSPTAEEDFVGEGYGVERVPVMWNDFVLLGPPDDPAKVSESEDVAGALRKISETEAPFISRGDDSGTHKKELEIWSQAAVEPNGVWYVEAGQGMGATLTMANDKQAYILTDRGTYLSRVDALELAVAFEDDPLLVNPYSIIAVNPEKHPHVNRSGGERLIDWITSPRAQALIEDYRVNGRQIFHLFE